MCRCLRITCCRVGMGMAAWVGERSVVLLPKLNAEATVAGEQVPRED